MRQLARTTRALEANSCETHARIHSSLRNKITNYADSNEFLHVFRKSWLPAPSLSSLVAASFLVLNYILPRNLRDFVQESGRAGRDNQPVMSSIATPDKYRDKTLSSVKSQSPNSPAPRIPRHRNATRPSSAKSALPLPSSPTLYAGVARDTTTVQGVIDATDHRRVFRYVHVQSSVAKPARHIPIL